VRGPAIFALGMLATGSAAGANTVVAVSVQRCSSSPNPVIAVTEQDRGVRGARLDIYHEIDHGERPAWGGLTDKRGMAKPPALAAGTYRIVADSGKLDATMFLTVSSDGGNAAKCEIKLTLPDAPGTLDALAQQTASVRVREFRGVVQDELGAVVQHAKIRVLRKSSDKEDLAKIQSDERGQFSLDLRRGTYLAVFQVPGFKMQVVGFKVAKDGWDAVRLTMEVAGTSRNVPPEKWDLAK
jgi:hypothetical protein